MGKNVRSRLPRKSSPEGIRARLDARLAEYESPVPNGNGNRVQLHRKPGSTNRRKH